MGADAAPEEQFGPYLVYERLGVGGMATVHRALELGSTGTQRVVALKRLLPHLAEDASFIKSFVREAKLASLLSHVNIVQIFELGRVGTEYFISMEYIDGRDVRTILRHARRVTGPPPVHVTIALMAQLLDALDYAHHKADDDGKPLGIVHRDVSPSNLLVTAAGHLKVIDFGIAKAESSQLRTQTGRVKGKLAYMAPEAVSGGKDLDSRSDVWAAGVILHELLTARPLFASKNEYQTLLKVQRGDIMPPSTFNQSCPPELEAIVFKALARDPDQRFALAADMREQLLELRAQYQYKTGYRDIAAWLATAFAHEGAAPDAAPARRPSTPKPARNRDEDEAVEMVWGAPSADDGQPVELPDVPDVSGKIPLLRPDLDPDTDPNLRAAPERLDPADAELAAALEQWSDDIPTTAAGTALEEPETATAHAALPLEPEPPPVAHAQNERKMPVVRFKPPSQPPRIETTEQVRRRRPSTEIQFGTALVERHRSRKPWLVVLIALLVLGGAGGAIALIASTHEPKPKQAEPAQPPPASPGKLKFVVEPQDAEIRVEGQPPHVGSPWSVELAAGQHPVEVRRSGYKSWLTSLELSSGESQLVRVELAPLGTSTAVSDATLSITTSPDGLDVWLDGRLLAQRTPIKMTIKVGPHALAVHQNGVEVWHQNIVAEANSDYAFNPPLTKQRAISVSRPHGEPATAPAAPPDAAAPLAPPDAAPVPVLEPPKPIVVDTPKPQPAPPPQPAVSKNPVVVPPTAVMKVSGATPNLTIHNSDLPPKIIAKICIDVRGVVSSVDVLTKIDGEATRDLIQTLHMWRYAPYRQGANAVPACFAVAFKTQ